MFGSEILEIVIGVGFMLLLLSLISTATNEFIAAVADLRAKELQRGIRWLVGQAAIADALETHPLIRSLAAGEHFPSYIPSSTFAMALLDIVAPAKVSGEDLGYLRSQIFEMPDSDLKRTLMLMSYQSPNLDSMLRSVENWFANAMDAVSGAYKRGAQLRLLIIGALLAVAINVDTLTVINGISTSSPLRAAIVASTQAYAQQQPNSKAWTIRSETLRTASRATAFFRSAGINHLCRPTGRIGFDESWVGPLP
jgi:hypothetical protein